MNSRQLEYFLAVARELNFTRAAERMFVSQTAVTQQIRALEDHLGVSLFERTRKKVTLTPAGKVFLDEAVGILSRIDAAVERTRQASSGVIGSLDIGFFVGMGNTVFSEDIRRFNRTYPNIGMNFKCVNPPEMLQLLKRGELDLILTPIFDENYFEGVNFRRVFSSSLIAVVPQGHILAQKHHVGRRDLKDENLILQVTPDSEIGEVSLILNSFWKRGYYPNVLAKIMDIETIFLMISINMGVTILPDYLTIPISSRGKIAAIPFGNADDHIDSVVAWMPENENPSLEKILPFLREEEKAEEEKEE